MSASRLYEKHSQAALVAMRDALCSAPESRESSGLYLYKPAVRRKLNTIDLAITYHLADTRARKGDPVPTNGYSGRNSNRR